MKRIRKISNSVGLIGNVVDDITSTNENDVPNCETIKDYIDNKILSKPNGLSYPISGDKDLNNIVKNGFYYGNDLVNGPSNLRYGYLLVIAHNSLATYCTQIFVPMSNNNTYLYFRNLYNDTWTSWMRLTGTAVS